MLPLFEADVEHIAGTLRFRHYRVDGALPRRVWQDAGMDREQILDILHGHEAELKSAGIVRLSLFGSYALGTAVRHVSNVDLMAEFDSGWEYSLPGRVRLENRLAEMPGTKVDLAPAGMLRHCVRERATRGCNCLLDSSFTDRQPGTAGLIRDFKVGVER